MRRHAAVLAIALGIVLGCARPVLAQVGYSGSLYAVTSRSDTGDRTRAWYFVNSLDVSAGPVRVTVMLPALSQELTWTDQSAVPPTQTIRSSGVGDPVFRVDVDLTGSRADPGAVRLKVSAAVKPPMRSVESGLGSGRADAAFGAALSGGWGRNTWLVDASYWVLGDRPELPLRNTPAVYVGYGRILDANYLWSFIAAASSSPSVLPGLPTSTQLNLTALRLVTSSAGLAVTVGLGLTDSAPDLSIGASWRVGL
jgi:hypothetical protein